MNSVADGLHHRMPQTTGARVFVKVSKSLFLGITATILCGCLPNDHSTRNGLTTSGQSERLAIRSIRFKSDENGYLVEPIGEGHLQCMEIWTDDADLRYELDRLVDSMSSDSVSQDSSMAEITILANREVQIIPGEYGWDGEGFYLRSSPSYSQNGNWVRSECYIDGHRPVQYEILSIVTDTSY